jgi:sec-independent protein translocase protein TatA
MPFHVGPLELMIVFLIVILLFGAGRIGKLAGELGKGIREFRSAVSSPEKKDDEAV